MREGLRKLPGHRTVARNGCSWIGRSIAFSAPPAIAGRIETGEERCCCSPAAITIFASPPGCLAALPF